MQVWPAIDLRGGKCVRLQQGDYQRETVFAEDPAAVARRFVEQGARHVHIVDLEGAREGLPVNLPSVQEILEAVDIECE
ncbi:MAG: HisA/HisF-related TIM barrel protein, partial [Pirellulales bacterium]